MGIEAESLRETS
jgi:hypothetical protein